MNACLRYLTTSFIIFLPFLVLAQPKKIKDELKRAGNYDYERKKFDTYHVYEKYLTTEQRYELNMYYWTQRVDIPHETANNYWLLKSAQTNNICAQINVAYSYKTGRTVKKDNNKCRHWLLKAIGNKSASALYYYGLGGMNDIFSKPVNDSSIYYLEKAANLNMDEAYLATSYCHKYGINTVSNDSLANAYLKKYETNGHFISLDSSIYCPTGFCDSMLIEREISGFLKQLQVDTLLELTIKTSGNRDYTEMQRSWDKADFIRTVFIENGLDPKRVSFIYGEPGNPSVIKIIIRKKADKFWGYHPAPPISGITGKYYIMKCN